MIVRYFLVGGTAAAVDIGIFTIFAKILGFPWFSVAVIGFILATLVNYVLSVRHVFDSGVRFTPRQEIMLTFLVSAVGLGVNQAVLWYFIETVHMDLVIAKLLATGTIFFWNYFGRKHFIFKSPHIPQNRESEPNKQWLILLTSWSMFPAMAIGSGVLIVLWFIYYGESLLLTNQSPKDSLFFDAQAYSLTRWRLDVPCNVIVDEAYVFNNHCYGYFGITPSLFRIPLNLLFPVYQGKWALLSILSATGIFLASTYSIVKHFHKLLLPKTQTQWNFTFAAIMAILLLGLWLGFANLSLFSKPTMYQEAYIWSIALAVCSVGFALRFWGCGRLSPLILCGLLAGLSANAHLWAGLLAACVCGFMPFLRIAHYPSANNHPSLVLRVGLIAGPMLALLALASYLAVTCAKFHTLQGMYSQPQNHAMAGR